LRWSYLPVPCFTAVPLAAPKGDVLPVTQPLSTRLWSAAVWTITGFFILNLLAMIATVITSSLATRWLGTWLPAGWTVKWYFSAWDEFQLDDLLVTTFEAVFAVVLVSGAIGVPAAYALARRQFPGKKIITLLFLVPLLVPPVTYGIPLATVLYKAGIGGTLLGVIAANLVPSVPFVILVMVPFIEQIDPRIEAAARVFGAGTFRLFTHILLPLLLPGALAALLLVLVRTIAMFELTFLTSGPTSQTLVVALYYAVFAAGVRAVQSIDAMAVVYMLTTLVWLLLALRFVNPTQIVTRGKQESIG
jgi:putative spermidine/putrescine transport system permease protein